MAERGLGDATGEARFTAGDLSGGAGRAKASPSPSRRGAWDDTTLSGGWEATAPVGEDAGSVAADGDGARDSGRPPGTANVTLRIGGDGRTAGLGGGAVDFVKHRQRPPWTSALGRGFSGMGIHADDDRGGPVVARATVTAGTHEGCSPGKKAPTALVPAGMVEAVTARRRSDWLSGRRVAFWANLEGDGKSTPLASPMTA